MTPSGIERFEKVHISRREDVLRSEDRTLPLRHINPGDFTYGSLEYTLQRLASIALDEGKPVSFVEKYQQYNGELGPSYIILPDQIDSGKRVPTYRQIVQELIDQRGKALTEWWVHEITEHDYAARVFTYPPGAEYPQIG